jgi:probable phosphoglycerate mutase
MERAVETARPIARRLGLRVRVERGLLECDVGTWTGLSLKALRRRREWRKVLSLPSAFRFPGGESFAEMQARMVSTLDRLAEQHAG